MGWSNYPVVPGVDQKEYSFLTQIPRALREKAWMIGSLNFPRTSFVWSTGTITSAVDNGDGSYTLGHTDDGTTGSRFFGYTGHPPTPANYDLIINDPENELNCLHLRIYGSANTPGVGGTFKVDSAGDHLLPDLATSAFFYPNLTTASLLASLVGRSYYVVVRGGESWHERWFVWPNDQEAQSGTSLTAGALQLVTSLTSSGTTATAVVVGHQFITGDSATIAGAVSSGSHYNGTFTVTVLDADTFTYTIIADDPTATGTPTAKCTAVGAADVSATWVKNRYATGYILMVNGNDGLLKRITLTGSNTNSVTFARQSYTVSGQYAIMPEDNTNGEPSRYRFYNTIDTLCNYNDMHQGSTLYSGSPSLWYNSRFDGYWTRSATTDGVTTTKLPATGVPLNEVVGGVPTVVQVPCFNIDVWTDITDTLNPADKNYTPDLYRTIDGWQSYIQDLVTEGSTGVAISPFAVPIDYTARGAITPFTRARLFDYCGINSQTGTTGALSGGALALTGFTFPWLPINVFFDIQAADGSTRRAGAGSIDAGGNLNWDNGAFGSAEQFSPVIISLGWTRNYPKAFKYMYTKQCWIPTADAVTGNATDPPGATTPGSWPLRSPSTKYKEHDITGFVTDIAEFRNFATNDFARYDGDNFNDPVVQPPISSSDTHGFATYYNNRYEGRLNPTNQLVVDASMTGVVTASDTMWISDSTKNWWPGGVMVSSHPVNDITGTATGGTTTDLTDSTKNGNVYWTTGVRGLLGFIVKVTISGTDHYRRVFAHPGNSPAQIFWTEPLPASASGKVYEVRWPKYEANQWADRILTMAYPDTTVHTVTITANDDKKLFFADLGTAPPVGTTYTITERRPNGVWRWTGSAWVAPTGNDPRTGVAWHVKQQENLPMYTTNYGKFLKGDYTTPQLLNDIQAACNALSGVIHSYGWTSAGGVNYKTGANSGNLNFAGGSGAFDLAIADYASSGSSSNANPFAASYTNSKCAGSGSIACYDYAVGRRFSYGSLTLSAPQVIRKSTIDYYVFSLTPNDVSTGGSGQGDNPTCPSIAVFDSQGDAVIEGLWSMFDSTGPDNTTSRTSGSSLGSATRPTDIGPAAPTCPTDCNWFQGYVVTDWKCIVKYNVAGGNVYQ